MNSTKQYADSTSITSRHPWGLMVSARVLCTDGRVRTTSRLSTTADTFFSVPAAVKVSGRTVSGYITVETRDGYSTETDDDPAVVKFVATSGQNAHLLPARATA